MSETRFIKDESHFSGKYGQTVFHTISMAISQYRKRFIFVLLLGFLGRALLLANANVIGKWADTLCVNAGTCPKKSSLFSDFSSSDFLLLLFVTSILGFLFLACFRIGISRMGTHCSSRFYDETTLRVSRFPMSFFDKNPIGRIISRFSSDYNAVMRMTGGPLGEMLMITFDLLLFFILISIASPFYIPLLTLSVFLNYFIYKINKHKVRYERRELSASRGPALAHFAETVQGSKIIRIFGKSNNFMQKFSTEIQKYIQQKNKSNMVITTFSLQMGILNVSLFFITGIVGILLLRFHLVSLGSIGVAFTFVTMTSSTIQVFFEWVTSLEDALTGTERLDEYLNKDLEAGASLPANTKFKTRHKILLQQEEDEINKTKFFELKNCSLKVENLSLKYEKNLPFALQDVNLNIQAGEKIGVIGRTGSGKSSLIQALFHLYPFVNGRILINNMEADIGQIKVSNGKYVDLNLFRSAISLIAQEPSLFMGTLRDNFTVHKGISDEEIIHVAHLVGLKKLFSKNKDALNMLIHEKGANLSAGERQLVCMVRCLLQKSPIVLMDEATSAIDPHSEELLVNATEHFLKEKTQIIVAHRLSTLENCDRIFWFEAGKLILEGPALSTLSAFQRFEENLSMTCA